MEKLTAPVQALLDQPTALLAAEPQAADWYTAVTRLLFPALAVLILFRAVNSLLTIPHTPENWGQLSLPNGTPIAAHPLGEHPRPGPDRRRAAQLPQRLPPARGPVPGR